jgi:phosphohistidine phosphatase SixA
MNRQPSVFFTVFFLIVGCSAAPAADLQALILSLKEGGHVMVFRHGATDDTQKDVYPFKFDDMKAQRQLSEKGREVARQIGAAINELNIPLGEVYSSRLNRALETARLLSGKEVSGLDVLTDTSAGVASAMANPAATNARAGAAIRDLVNASPVPGTNTLLVTHKTNFADAFGKEAADVQEGEAFVYRSGGSGPAKFVGRVKSEDWTKR